MQNDSFKMRQHYAPYNRSEESHRVSEEYIFYGKPPSREFAALTARKDSILGLSIVRWDISLALNMTYFLFPIGTSCLAMKVKIKKENGGRFPFFDCILIYYSVLSVLLLPKNVPQPLVLGRG